MNFHQWLMQKCSHNFLLFFVTVFIVFGVAGISNDALAAVSPAQILLDSSVFDANYYRAHYPGLVNMSDAQLRNHWINHGIQEGRQAHLKFYWKEYQQIYKKLGSAFGNDGKKYVTHYVKYGKAEGRTPVFALDPSVFDATYLSLRYSDLKNLSKEQLETHWLLHGIQGGRQANALFYVKDYSEIYPDLKNYLGSDPNKYIRHYVVNTVYGSEKRVGVPEIDPLVFDVNYYKNKYPDAKNLTEKEIKIRWINDLENSIDRSATAFFNPKDYQQLNSGVSKNRREAVREYVFNRSLSMPTHRFFDPSFFSVKDYQELNKDLSTMTQDQAKSHWFNSGMKEGRVAIKEGFSIRKYIENTKPWLSKIFDKNYALAWDFYIDFEKNNPYTLLPSVNADKFDTNNKTTFRIDDYGADPTGIKDSTSAMVAVLNDIKKYQALNPEEKRVLVFGDGSYLFASAFLNDTHPNNPYNTSGYMFHLAGIKNLVIAGVADKTKLINAKSDTGFFFVSESDSVFFRDLIFDYQKMPYLQGTVQGISKVNNDVIITLAPENSFQRVSDSELNRDILDGTIVVYDSKRKGIRKDNTFHFYKISSIANASASYKLTVLRNATHQQNALKDIKPGDNLVFFRRAKVNFMRLNFNNNIGLYNVEINASPCTAFVVVGNQGDIIFDRVMIKPSKNRTKSIVSTNADGIHAQSNRSPLIIQNSYFQGMGDDAVNLYSVGGVVSSVNTGNNTIAVHNTLLANVGDVIEFINPQTGAVLGQGKVQEPLKKLTNGTYQYTFNSLPAGITGGVVNLQQSYTNTVAYNTTASNAGSRFVNNIVGPLRGSGIRIKAPNSVVQDNIFMHVDMNAINIENLYSGFVEGPIPHDIVIKNNRITGSSYPASPVIFVGNRIFSSGQGGRVENIEIIDNKFFSYGTEAIQLHRVDNASIKRNFFGSNGEDERYDWNATSNDRSVVEIRNSGSAIDISDNTFQDKRRFTGSNISF